MNMQLNVGTSAQLAIAKARAGTSKKGTSFVSVGVKAGDQWISVAANDIVSLQKRVDALVKDVRETGIVPVSVRAYIGKDDDDGDVARYSLSYTGGATLAGDLRVALPETAPVAVDE